ncbi:CI family repressor [Buttiauxella brennerae ATCC 51605]|uniref:CI family repressor n=1 Tax=Buttiauxella brennerae ATCC 51605 TaxID=1354251 RepID=A0A1B7IQR4_9ENTR|nr:phage repressor protein CI [Buttiauxella brennerae]OAT32093.1 CI family repressor [Buttiauxella brennerae ATCC 51605]
MSKRTIDAVAALERILVVYGFKQQKDLAEHIGIHGNNVSSWLARNTIPSSVFLECHLDTGADIHWLMYGEFANASCEGRKHKLRGKALLDLILESGGKAVLRRMLDAYGFTTQKELGDLLEISSATISTWIRRDFFPGDIVVACALDTGVSLEWLATGKGAPLVGSSDTHVANYSVLKKFSIISGSLDESGEWICDKSLTESLPASCGFVEKISSSWIVDFGQTNLGNGRWLISIDGIHDVYNIARIPGNKIQVVGDAGEFQCLVTDIVCVGKVRKTVEDN